MNDANAVDKTAERRCQRRHSILNIQKRKQNFTKRKWSGVFVYVQTMQTLNLHTYILNCIPTKLKIHLKSHNIQGC
jgi:hypothetical protein